jgi:hypothetical protein
MVFGMTTQLSHSSVVAPTYVVRVSSAKAKAAHAELVDRLYAQSVAQHAGEDL